MWTKYIFREQNMASMNNYGRITPSFDQLPTLLSTRSRHVTTRSVQTAWRSWQRRSGQSRVPPVGRSTTYIWFSTRKICECDCKPTEGSDHERASWMHSDPEWRHQTPQGQNVSCVKASQLHSGANDCGGVKIASMSACVVCAVWNETNPCA